MFILDTDLELLSLTCFETLDDFAFPGDLDLGVMSEDMELVGEMEPLPLSPFYLDAVDTFSSSLMLPPAALPLDDHAMSMPPPPPDVTEPPLQHQPEQLEQPKVEVERVVEITPRKKKRKRGETCADQPTPAPSQRNVEVCIDPERGLLKRIRRTNVMRMWCSRHCSPSAHVRACELSEWRDGYQRFEFK